MMQVGDKCRSASYRVFVELFMRLDTESNMQAGIWWEVVGGERTKDDASMMDGWMGYDDR